MPDLLERRPVCLCDHTETYHVPGGGSCTASGCTCRGYAPAGGVNAAPLVEHPAMDGHHDPTPAVSSSPAPGPSRTSAAGGPYLDAVRLAWPAGDDDAVREHPDLALSQIHELADLLAAALTADPARDIWTEVAEERARAHRKHGATSMESADVADGDGTRRDILTEELGEVAREYNEARHERRPVDLMRVRRELVQLAAMAAAWADAIVPGPRSLTGLCPGCHHTWALHRRGRGCTTLVTIARDVCPCQTAPPEAGHG